MFLGRQQIQGDFVLDHPSVSRRHAVLEVKGGASVLRDLGSTNGTYVNGQRLDQPRRLQPGDRIDIGPFQLVFDGTGLTRSSRSGNISLGVEGIGFDVPAKRILDGATFEVRPREFVCIVGASGSGKTTLLSVLSGRALPSAGSVTLNGRDLHADFQALKQDMAFVPQQDALHDQLTLRQALGYAARLRLPPDTSRAQLRATVEKAASDVDLAASLDTRIASLSGGQKKRASLACEILNRPSLLFLDEVTSGLDESTDWEIMSLLRRLADGGMTIIMVTHTLANIQEFCDKVVCMGRGGHTTFVGHPAEALRFFGISRLGEVFNKIETNGGAPAWRSFFERSASFVRPAPRPAPSGEAQRRPRQAAGAGIARIARQFAILARRNTRLLIADRRTLAIAAVQSVLIGGLMGYAFGDFGRGQEVIAGKKALLFLLGLTSIWIGCNGASKDIVGELEIFKRERDVNLSTAAFVAAKYVVTAVFTAIQLVGIFLLCRALAQSVPGDPWAQFGVLLIGSMAGTGIGLFISSMSNTRDQATTIVPLALVPQIILAGVLIPMHHLSAPARHCTHVTISSFWLTEALNSNFIAAEGPVMVPAATAGRLEPMKAEPMRTGVLVLLAHTLGFVLLTYLAALLRYGGRRKGVRRH